MILLVLFILVALFPGLIAHDNPTPRSYQPGCSACPCARTGSAPPRYGQDIFAQVIDGTRPVLVLAVVAGGLATTLIAC